MRIAFAVSEIVPYSKTGGLADVAAALPHALARLGQDVRVFAPLHAPPGAAPRPELRPFGAVQDVPLALGGRTLRFSLRAADPSGDHGAPVFLVDCPALYERREVYTADPDEPLRFALLSHAVFESCRRMGFHPDVLHCNDWHTALIPLMLRTLHHADARFRGSRTLLTIHNIAYQGVFPAATIEDLGLSAWTERFDERDRATGHINFLRTGVAEADAVSTVSPTYAREILGAQLGMGLEADLAARADPVVGILNGVDYRTWSPETDAHIPRRYSARELEGKRENKRRLRERLGLAPRAADAPLAGIVSRLVQQKGLDLCVDVLPESLATTDLELAVLGRGDPRYEAFFETLAQDHPGRVAYRRGHDEDLAHWIEAGSDLFLMPSHYEPCGLNQLFSLRYGTIPVVRKTGGLADSVQPYDPQGDTGTGFVFEHFTADGLRGALRQALATYADGLRWQRLMQRAMSEDFSWATQARHYIELYERIAARG